MRPYSQPDFDIDIAVLRAEIERDYTHMAGRLKLPKRLDFSHACAATLAGGMGIHDGSPYETFKKELLDAVASSSKKEEYEPGEILEILTGVWNHFPHKDLDGLSPIEKMRSEYTASDAERMLDDLDSIDIETYEEHIDREILLLSDTVAKNFLEHLKKIGFDKKEGQHIIDILSDPKRDPSDALSYLFSKMIHNSRVKQKTFTIDDIQPAVRALMWCENHTASKMSNGHWGSRMFQNIVEQAMHYNTHVVAEAEERSDNKEVLMVDPFRTLEALSLIHDAISEYSAHFNLDIGIEESTRHLVDWLALVDIHELIVQEDLNITTLYFLGAARLIAATGDPTQPYVDLENLLRKEIAQHADAHTFDDEVKRIAEKVLNATQDPVMLMPYPGKEPDDCEDRLAQLAPDLKLRSPLNGDLLFTPPPDF